MKSSEAELVEFAGGTPPGYEPVGRIVRVTGNPGHEEFLRQVREKAPETARRFRLVYDPFDLDDGEPTFDQNTYSVHYFRLSKTRSDS